MRKCIFCDNRANSREHVIAEWLTNRMDWNNTPHGVANYSETKGFKYYPPLKFEKFRTKQVCSTCNGGWMSALEANFQNAFGDLVEKRWVDEEKTIMTLLSYNIELLKRWLLKTAIIVELASPKGELISVNPKLYKLAKDGGDMSFLHVFAGEMVSEVVDIKLQKGSMTWNGNKLQYQIHNLSLNFGIQLNHLGLLLISCPDATIILKAGILDKNKNPILPFKPGQKGITYIKANQNSKIKVSHIFPDISWLINSVEVKAKPSKTKE